MAAAKNNEEIIFSLEFSATSVGYIFLGSFNLSHAFPYRVRCVNGI